MSLPHKRELLMAGGLVALAGVVSLAIFVLPPLAAASSNRPAQPPPEDPSAMFSVFQRSTAGQPALPMTIVNMMRRMSEGGRNPAAGIEPARVQHVQVAGRNVWLIPGPTKLCMVLFSYPRALAGAPVYNNFMCTPLARAAAGRFLVWLMHPSGAQTIIGLAPDTNQSIMLTTRDGATVQAPVVNNMFTATSTGGFRGYQIRDASGQLQTIGRPAQP